MREWAFYRHVRAAVGDSEWHHFTVACDDKSKQIIGWREGEQIGHNFQTIGLFIDSGFEGCAWLYGPKDTNQAFGNSIFRRYFFGQFL